MESSLRIYCLINALLCVFTLPAQEVFSCSDANGAYFITLTNPNATDGDDGTIDGNCEYMITTSIFSSTSPVIFTYVGANTAVPNSVSQSFFPLQMMTITAPCGNLDLAFDMTDSNGDDVCSIRNAVMPVELVTFQGKSTELGVKLNWVTASEINNLGFDVERSADGKTWEKIGFMEGHLTTLFTQQYEFTDTKPIPDIAYYRLKQMDIGGQFEYSNIIVMKHLDGGKKFSISPNPATDKIHLELPANEKNGSLEIWVFNYLGKLIKQENTGSNFLNINYLEKGFYNLIVKKNNQIYTAQFIKK